MNEAEQALADRIYSAIQHDTNYSARSLQSKDFRVGISDLGFCSERTRRMLDQQVPDDTDMLPAWLGTAIGDYLERAILKAWPDAILQAEISVTLTGERGMTFTLPGHPDAVLPSGVVIDGKTVDGFHFLKRSGPSQQQQFQRHLYAVGAWEAGMFDEGVALEDVQVANVWVDRSGRTRHLQVHMEPFSPEWVEQAAQWTDDVVYAWTHEEEARKEPPRQMCAKACGFFKVCRAFDTDVEGLITYPEHLTAIDLYREGAALTKKGRQMTDEAKVILDGISGSTGEVQLRWIWQNTSGGGYYKVDMTEIPKRVVTA